MDIVSAVEAALLAGAAAGTSGVASRAVEDAYAALKRAVSSRSAGHPGAAVVLPDPHADRAATHALVVDAVRGTTADQDSEVVAAAREVLRLSAPPGRYQVDLRDARAVMVGDGNTQHNTFNER